MSAWTLSIMAFVWLTLSALGLVVISQDNVADAPATVTSCPTEDSCSADYRDGAWHIERIQP